MVFFSHTHTDINTHGFVPLNRKTDLLASISSEEGYPPQQTVNIHHSRRTEILMDAAPPPLSLKR